MRATTPLRICPTNGAWTGSSELAATVRSRKPNAAVSASTRFRTASPFLKW